MKRMSELRFGYSFEMSMGSSWLSSAPWSVPRKARLQNLKHWNLSLLEQSKLSSVASYFGMKIGLDLVYFYASDKGKLHNVFLDIATSAFRL